MLIALASCLRKVDEELGRDRLVAAAEGRGVAADTTVAIPGQAFEAAGEMTRLFGYERPLRPAVASRVHPRPPFQASPGTVLFLSTVLLRINLILVDPKRGGLRER